MKKSFNTYYKEKFETQPTSDRLFRQLHQQLFQQPKTTVVERWRSFIPRTLGLGVLSLAIISLIYLVQNNVVDTFDPKVALAQSLDNTFGAGLLLQSFGLGNPDEFRYRKMIVQVPHQLPRPEYISATEEATEYTFTTELELWEYQGSARADIASFDYSGETHYSYYLSNIDQQRCISEQLTSQADRTIECQSQQRFVKEQLQDFKKHSTFVPNVDSNWVKAIEVTPTLQLRWATTDPIGDTVIAYTGSSRLQPPQNLYDIPNDLVDYMNRSEGNLYWHSTQIRPDVIGDGVFYIQFINGERATPIYEYRPTQQDLIMTDYLTLLQNLKDTTLQKSFTGGIYQTYLIPILFLQQHLDQLADPIVQETTMQDGQRVMRLRFVLPESYAETVYGGEGMSRPLVRPHSLEVSFNATTNEVLSYSLLDQNQVVMQEVKLSENKIITEVTPETFFTVQYWRAALEL